MSAAHEPERDPALGRTLELALAAPSPRPGAEQRIARRLDERLEKRARGWPFWAVLGACVLSACAGVLFGPRLVRSRSTAAGTSEHAWLTLRTARATLVGAASLRVERDDESGTELNLSAGTALFHVQKGTGRRFAVNAGSARVEVVGTVFGVALEHGRAAVEVLEGVVRFTQDGVTQTLRAGEHSPGGAHLFTLTSDELARLRATVTVAGPAAASALTESAPPLAASPLLTAPAVPTAAGGALRAGARTPIAAPPSPKTRTAAPATAPLPAAASGAPGSAEPSAYQRARALERDGALAEAGSAYSALATAGGRDAEDATFALARMPAERGNAVATLAAVAQYRAAYPNGRYARDIDVFELNAHLAAHDDSAALRNAESFLAHFGNDARAWRFRLVRATSRARGNDCDGARSDLEHVPDGAAKSAAFAPCAP